MAFRNHKFSPCAPPVQSVVEQNLKCSTVDGVDIFVPVDVDTRTRPPLPSLDDYRLSALLSSGAPLTFVNPQVFENLELDAQHFVEDNLSVDDITVPRETVENEPNSITD